MNFSIKKTGLFISALGFVALSNTTLAEVQNETLTTNGEVVASTCTFTFTDGTGGALTSLTLNSISESEVLQGAAGSASAFNEAFFNLDFQACANTQNIQVDMTAGAVGGGAGTAATGVTLGVFSGPDNVETNGLNDINLNGGSTGTQGLSVKYIRNAGTEAADIGAGTLTRDFSFQVTYL